MQSQSGKLFIGGISWDTNEERLKDYFSNFGEVIEAVILKDRITGRARGFGFVVFADPAVAEQVTKEKHNLDGRMVEAKRAVPMDDQSNISRSSSNVHGSPGPGSTRKIFVGGLASTVTEGDFRKYFEQFGTITDVVVMYDHKTQRPRGFGFITYNSEDAVNKVLLRTFHELNGKIVEVKRAVPKELSPGATRSPFGGYNYGVSCINNIPNGYTTGIGRSELRMDGSFSPVSALRSEFSPYGLGYGFGMNFEPSLNPSYGGTTAINRNLNYAQGLNPYFMGNSNRFASPIGYDGDNGGNSSFFSSVTRNLWGSDGLRNPTNSNSHSMAGSIGGSTFGNTGVNWTPSESFPQGQAINNYEALSYGAGNATNALGLGAVGRNNGTSLMQTSPYRASHVGHDGAFPESYGSGSVYGDSPWQSSGPNRIGSGSIGYALGRSASDVSDKGSPGYVGGYIINKKDRGIAA